MIHFIIPFKLGFPNAKISQKTFISRHLETLSIADLYDSSKAEVLGQIKTSSVADYANKNWANGHYLVVQWETPLPSHVIATPYGDYYDPATNTDADSTIQVWETFVNHMVS